MHIAKNKPKRDRKLPAELPTKTPSPTNTTNPAILSVNDISSFYIQTIAVRNNDNNYHYR